VLASGVQGAAHDLAIANPPYHLLSSGPASPDEEIAIAQHELKLTLADVVREARRILAPGGRAALVYPADRLPELLAGLDGEGLRPLRLRLVHPTAEQPALRALVEARKGARGPLVVHPPLYLRDDDGQYTSEARRALGEI
jgi:tRNA1Val (adenine37-N6)-methyltransferase